MGKGKNKYTAEQFIKAIPGTGGIISAIARKVDCEYLLQRCLFCAKIKRGANKWEMVRTYLVFR